MMVAAVGITSEVLAPEATTGTLPRMKRRMGLLDCLVVSGDPSRRRRFEACPAAPLRGPGMFRVPAPSFLAGEGRHRATSRKAHG